MSRSPCNGEGFRRIPPKASFKSLSRNGKSFCKNPSGSFCQKLPQDLLQELCLSFSNDPVRNFSRSSYRNSSKSFFSNFSSNPSGIASVVSTRFSINSEMLFRVTADISPRVILEFALICSSSGSF